MPEQQNIEWKESWRDEYLEWICGFANANGGNIFVGMNDKGEVIGVSNSKRLMDDIPNKIQTNLGIIFIGFKRCRCFLYTKIIA